MTALLFPFPTCPYESDATSNKALHSYLYITSKTLEYIQMTAFLLRHAVSTHKILRSTHRVLLSTHKNTYEYTCNQSYYIQVRKQYIF